MPLGKNVNKKDLLSIIGSSDQKLLVPVDPNYGPALSKKDQLIFDAVLKLCEDSELYATEPVIFFEGTGIYKNGDLFFERQVLNLYNPPYQNKREFEHYIQSIGEEKAIRLKEEWRGSAAQLLGEFKDFEKDAREAFPEYFSENAGKRGED